MKVNDIIMGIVGIMLCVVMIGGAFLPAISSAMISTSETVEFTQDGDVSSYSLGKYTGSDDYVIEYNADGFIINGVLYEYADYTEGWVIVAYADSFYIRANTTDKFTQLYAFVNPQPTYTLVEGASFTINGGTCDIVGTVTTPTTINYSVVYLMGVGSSLDYLVAYNMSSDGNDLYLNSLSDIIIYGVYLTGDNDTMYSFIDGKMTVSEDYTCSAHYELEKVEGYLDLYKLNRFYCEVGDEAFTPYLSLVPGVIEGHKSTGAITNMFSILPIVAIAGLVMVGIYVFISRK